MTNPLIDKYNELYGPKEEPKPIISNIPNLKTATKFTTYNIDSMNQHFLQVAELLEKGEAKITSVSVEQDHYQYSGRTITFKVHRTITFEVQV